MKNEQKGIIKATRDAAVIPITKETIRTYINAKASDQEVTLFLNLCSLYELNPFKREVYLIKYSEKDPASFVVGYEVYLKRAQRSLKWSGLETGTEDGPNGKPIKAWAKVYRTDWKAPLYHEVFLDEYIQKKADGTPTRFWAEKPRTMLKKVVIAQAFRLAFPDELGGMPYTSEEMPIDHATLPTAEVKMENKYPGLKNAEVHAPAPVADEFGEAPPVSAGTIMASDGQQKTLRDAIESLKNLGKSEETIWTGIVTEVKKVHGIAFTDTNDMTEDMAQTIIDYVIRWALHIKNGVAKSKASVQAKA